MSTSVCESTVEEAALGWLEELEWQVLHGPDIAPDEPTSERVSYCVVSLRNWRHPA